MNFFNSVLQAKGFPISKARQDLSKLSALSQEQLLKWSEERKWEILEYHLKNTPAYRDHCPNLPKYWSEIPPIKKSHLQKPLDILMSKDYSRDSVYIGNTSGSSGHPFYYAKDKYAHARTWALIENRYSWYGITFKSKQARFYGIPLEGVGYYKEKLKDLVMNRVRFPVFDMSDYTLVRYLDKFRHQKFEYVYGYTSAIVLFARFLIKQGIQLKEVCPSLKVCITTSEMCVPEDKTLIEQAMGIPVVREYGASELDVLAFEDICGRWTLSFENIFIEIVDEEFKPLPYGKEGKILVTSLFNEAMPFIRYEIGDLGVIGNDDKGIYLQKLTGRVNDVVKLPSGKTAAGLTFYYISRSILESGGALKEFIIKQVALDKFIFEVVSDSPLNDRERAGIQEKMDIYLEPGLQLEIHRVEQIQRSDSGKIKHFYSMIQ